MIKSEKNIKAEVYEPFKHSGEKKSKELQMQIPFGD